MQEQDVFLGERREGGKSATQPYHEQKPDFPREYREPRGEGKQEPHDEAPDDVYQKRTPRKKSVESVGAGIECHQVTKNAAGKTAEAHPKQMSEEHSRVVFFDESANLSIKKQPA